VKALRTLLVLLVILVAAYDTGSVAWTSLTVQTVADEAAAAAAGEWRRTHDVDVAYRVATARAAEDGLGIAPTAFTAEPDGTVRLRIRTEARTLVTHLVGPLRDRARITADGVAAARF
jgi:uncharacterized membrane protein